ncbi:MAG: HAMP domain-containing histidine kinase, partial [Oscillospiraceae bacterium]|nr:HAMP domain-containing histidine kinase [Oscillospiraceae bacterium]
AAAVNYFYLSTEESRNKPYMVEISRLSLSIEENGNADISECEYVESVEKYDGSEDFFSRKGTYFIRQIDGEIYRFDYSYTSNADGRILLIINIVLGCAAVAMIALLLFIRTRLLRPFFRFSTVPYEISKGNLTAPLKENKSRFFGKFVWGVNMLRENMEHQKNKELELIKEKQTLLLSISHDIKTPLSAIKLYSKALSKGIYDEKEKQRETAESIGEKADEIERLVTELTNSVKDDFMEFTVDNKEFYLSETIGQIQSYYSGKLSLTATNFTVEKYTDCLIFGDLDRSVKVFQNIMENAIKYGDGKNITISFSDEEDCRLVSISNSGCTLSEDEQVHIFDSFWRGSNSAGKNGSGLGLFICRKLMFKMEGDIFANTKDDIMTVTVVFKKL